MAPGKTSRNETSLTVSHRNTTMNVNAFNANGQTVASSTVGCRVKN